MDDIKMEEWVQWLEGCVRTLFEVGPVAIAMFARLPGGESMTAYYNCDAEEKAAAAHHFHSDAMLDVVLNNIALIKEEMEALDDAVGD